nr:hypothetical protein Itr_chr06CG00610 [Ipomoea trifida]
MPLGTQNAILARASPYSRNLPYFKLVGSNLPLCSGLISAICHISNWLVMFSPQSAVMLSPYIRNLPSAIFQTGAICHISNWLVLLSPYRRNLWFCSRLVGAICHAIFQPCRRNLWFCSRLVGAICHCPQDIMLQPYFKPQKLAVKSGASRISHARISPPPSALFEFGLVLLPRLYSSLG